MDYLNDKEWMYKYESMPARCNPDFVCGINYFVDYAKKQTGVLENGVMRCPCAKCENRHYLDCETIKYHIVVEGFVPLYDSWYYHGEQPQTHRENVPMGFGRGPATSGLSGHASQDDTDSIPAEDMEAQVSEDMEAQASEDMETQASEDVGTQASEDIETQASKDIETQASEDMGTQASEDIETQASEDMGTQASADIETLASEDTETQAPEDNETQPPKKLVQRRGRGPTRMSSLLPKGKETWTIQIKNGQMTSEKQSSLSKLMGTYVRAEQYFPLHLQWRQYPPDEYRRWFNHINKKYKFVNEKDEPVTANVTMKVLKPVLQKIIRDNRAAYKKTHYDGKTPEQLVANPIKTIGPDKWKLLVKYWDKESAKKMSEQNKTNRQLMKSTHTLGTKSLSRFYEEERSTNGNKFTFLESYLKAHQRKDGTYPDERTAKLCAEVVRFARERKVNTSKDPAHLTPILDKVFGGHHGGYERGVGTGAPLRRAASSSTSSHTTEIASLRAELQTEKDDKEAMREEMLFLRQQVLELAKWRSSVESSAGATGQQGRENPSS